jgi:hypothetical protein
MICGPTIIGLPIGSNVAYGFVFKDEADMPVDLADTEFVLRMTAKYPALALEFTTTDNPIELVVEENALIIPVGKPAYIADWLVLRLAPDITRQVPLGALTTWEIERRKDGDQRNWGIGIFAGYGGMNPDA